MKVRIANASFVTSVFKLSQLPLTGLPEVAFAGRSNVGKSSLLNRLLGRHNLVKVSSRPGFTQSLNYFLINDSAYFVDLPGYGYAKAPKQVQRKWHRLVDGYIETRDTLRGVVCILDIRRVPDQLDLDLFDYLHAMGRHIRIVLNKADKISQPKRQGRIKAVRERLPGLVKDPLIISARTGEGIQSLIEALWPRLFPHE